MAEGYLIDGASENRELCRSGYQQWELERISGVPVCDLNGYYLRTASECNGLPVYAHWDGGDSPVLFQPTNGSHWMVGPRESSATCQSAGAWISSSGDGGVCAKRPDGSRCTSWLEVLNCDGTWCEAPSIAVSRCDESPCCPPESRCCGIDCGAHGTLTNRTEACGCHCFNGYFGERCQFDPLPSLPPGAAEGFTIAGATNSWLDGRYERRSGECNGKPLYQLGDEEDGPLLFRPTSASYWNVADSSNGTCDDIGWISSRGSAAVGSGVCPLRPDAIGCAGRWLEYLDSAWQGAPSITVSP